MPRVKLAKLALLVVDVTSPILLFLSALYMVTGYQMLYPEVTLIPAARRLHVDLVLRVSTVVVGYLHGLSGLIILCERRVRNRRLRKAIVVAAALGLTALVALPLALDLYYGGYSWGARWRWGRR